MGEKIFGTDGIRGRANKEPITAEVALRVGMAAGLHFRKSEERCRVVIGKDTRLSGYMLEPAITAGFASVGMDPILVGPLPTPAVAMLTRSLRAAVGVMITASHNPHQDNGIKIFGPDGYKLSDQVTAAIERRMAADMRSHLAVPHELGRARRLDDAQGRYVEYVKQSFPKELRLDGLKIVVDCANGAAYRVAPEILWELGADVISVGDQPNGLNINENCGSTCAKTLRSRVLLEEADFGIAFDGDADRLLVCDENGAIVDGDQIISLIARQWLHKDILKGGGVAVTVMSNLGLEKYLSSLGLALDRTPVGDRHVAACMRDRGFNLGGEQSGHIILGEHGTTGDGLVTGLQVLAAIVEAGRATSDVCRVFEPLPQVAQSVGFNGSSPLQDVSVRKAIAAAEDRLRGMGRLLVRKSGTEPMIRIMAEGEDQKLVGDVVNDIAETLRAAA